VSKNVLIATVKPFSPIARDQVVAAIKAAGYNADVLESYADKAALLEAVGKCDAMIIRSDKIDAEVLAAGKNLKLVVRAGAGYDNVNCPVAKERGIAVMNTPGQNSNAVAELALAMMVYMARGQFNGKPGTELKGKTLGIHAYGAVGKCVATVAKGFGMTIQAFDPFIEASQIKAAGVEPVGSVEDLYRTSQYVSLHIPATAETKNSIGKALLSLLPEKGTLINTARKEVINEAELIEVFSARGDFRYATDIAPSDDTVKVLREKYADRFYATPKKMGAQTFEANLNAGVAAANQIVGFFERGERNFIVNGL
jgi:D-3-phosphoglycerate dehydrogenase